MPRTFGQRRTVRKKRKNEEKKTISSALMCVVCFVIFPLCRSAQCICRFLSLNTLTEECSDAALNTIDRTLTKYVHALPWQCRHIHCTQGFLSLDQTTDSTTGVGNKVDFTFDLLHKLVLLLFVVSVRTSLSSFELDFTHANAEMWNGFNQVVFFLQLILCSHLKVNLDSDLQSKVGSL